MKVWIERERVETPWGQINGGKLNTVAYVSGNEKLIPALSIPT
jgi:hypothetical protein